MPVHHKILLSLIVAGVVSCSHKKTLFESLPSSTTGIDFINKVEENDKYNVLDYMNIYTGAGVAAGDVNNDGLVDLYFSGNENSGRLYLNKGNFKFEDVTEKAGLITSRWCTGVSMVDINQDGWLDIYINVAGSVKFGNTANLLYINNKNGTFTEEAAKYGIADTRLTMNASFFDYDKDGDLDLFLITNPADQRVNDVNTITEIYQHGESPGTDILYRNNGNQAFTDVSREVGILKEGYSLGAAISDVNNDGWPDIYVSNDFLTSDILYINNGNGTFSDKTHECLKHTSFASMGNDVADFHNDGFKDLFVTNGYRQDVANLDFILYGKRTLFIGTHDANRKDRIDMLQKFQGIKVSNYLFKNNGDLTFKNMASEWGLDKATYSNGAVYGDLDNDGDLDLVINNLDGPASVYENKPNKINPNAKWLRINFNGPKGNRDGLGTKVYAWQGANMQYLYFSPYRGYLSTIEPYLHFGFQNKPVDSLKVVWPDGKEQLVKKPAINKLLSLVIVMLICRMA